MVGIHWWPVNSPHKGPVTRIMCPFDDVIIIEFCALFCCGHIMSVQWIHRYIHPYSSKLIQYMFPVVVKILKDIAKIDSKTTKKQDKKRIVCLNLVLHLGMILGMGSTNESRRYNVTPSSIGWAYIQNDPWCWYCKRRTLTVCFSSVNHPKPERVQCPKSNKI